MSLLIYDCEIIKCIPPRDGSRQPDLAYCEGWHDHQNMGISVIGTYSQDLVMRGACGYNALVNYHDQIPLPCELGGILEALAEEADEVVGFNSLSFDDALCRANGINITTTYDLLYEVRIASGQPGYYVSGETRPGYNLESLAQANLGRGKSGSGALAPKQWQSGLIEEVINYCLEDVRLTKELYDRRHNLIDPTNGQRLICR